MKDCTINDEELAKSLFEDDGLYCYNGVSKAVIIDENIVGFYTVKTIRDYLTIEYDILKMYRNKDLGKDFVNFVVDTVCKENENVSKIYLLIDILNDKSINVAMKNGFEIEMDADEQILEEMPNYRIYSRINKYYKNNKLHKL